MLNLSFYRDNGKKKYIFCAFKKNCLSDVNIVYLIEYKVFYVFLVDSMPTPICKYARAARSNICSSYHIQPTFGYKKHYRVKHSQNEFAKEQNNINGIENFWGLCKVRLARFKGIHKHKFYYHLKECEWNFNYRNKNLYICLLKSGLRKIHLSYLEPYFTKLKYGILRLFEKSNFRIVVTKNIK